MSFTERFCLAAVLIGLAHAGSKPMPIRLTHPSWEEARVRAARLLDVEGALTEEAWELVLAIAYDQSMPQLHRMMLADLMESGLSI